ncbi:hypothetical protein PGTUg99_034136 [Puccinia graminis f. sp. tritici]|uniref:Uncharacterized protein n=1 Tax=Puccinia graminis f. sp. tritici TaxID=56615 RepID=A0A5B0N3P6_PUCGR|nr:hypothetical protein PGTUg99_034136 [Puccinia graminis f. sp. tritici]
MLLEEAEFRAEIVRALNDRPDFRDLIEELNEVYEIVRLMKAAGILSDDGNPVPVRAGRNRERNLSESADDDANLDTQEQVNVAGILEALRFLRSPRIRPGGAAPGNRRQAENRPNEDSMASPSPLLSASTIFRNACRMPRTESQREGPVASSSKRPADEEKSEAAIKRSKSSL